jgi:aspartyl/asparaginyl-tRNA synthetase
MKRIFPISIAALWMTLSTASAFAQAEWLHVHVTEGGGKETVRINLPLSMVDALLPIIEKQHLGELKSKLPSDKFTVSDLRTAWSELKAQGDFQFVSVDSGDSRVRVALESGYVVIRSVEDADQEVLVQVPGAVVDALLSGPGEELNLAAAVRALRASGTGEFVNVRDGDTHVRVWIDGVSSGN